ncbi:unnamed protein product [Kuraishia capsulata CBS 1993]|uniref:Uncharacterized protein n=1 Tax=Kuraishia capsulata CBS 1993 TaxID=1382522 RepID=W6MQ56_9ASCO|nr:uncharacterized protein KUCA_T00004854001 [Kuraishia capsulata CBS 1993]CDK28869.1 unnamed protein product [Kuraishia capsulata CBS 1993]
MPLARIELATFALQVQRSTTKLKRQITTTKIIFEPPDGIMTDVTPSCIWNFERELNPIVKTSLDLILDQIELTWAAIKNHFYRRVCF